MNENYKRFTETLALLLADFASAHFSNKKCDMFDNRLMANASFYCTQNTRKRHKTTRINKRRITTRIITRIADTFN